MRTSPEAEIVKLLRTSAHDVGCQTKVRGFEATTDGYFLEHLASIPTVLFGPGSLEQAHKEDEYVEISQLVSAAKIYALTAFRFLR
jgi:acetylornithine deacetylase/succinyl-diaminopimelate desuccinylase-like protein